MAGRAAPYGKAENNADALARGFWQRAGSGTVKNWILFLSRENRRLSKCTGDGTSLFVLGVRGEQKPHEVHRIAESSVFVGGGGRGWALVIACCGCGCGGDGSQLGAAREGERKNSFSPTCQMFITVLFVISEIWNEVSKITQVSR